MKLDEVHALLLSVRDKEPYIPRIAPDGAVDLFFPTVPVAKPGLIWCWSVGGGGEADWGYFLSTTRPTDAAAEALVQATVRSHYLSYPETVGLRFDRDYAAFRHEREER